MIKYVVMNDKSEYLHQDPEGNFCFSCVIKENEIMAFDSLNEALNCRCYSDWATKNTSIVPICFSCIDD